MKIFSLQILAFVMCMICGLLATFILTTMELSGVRLVWAGAVSFGCIPLGVLIIYAAFRERKILWAE